MVYWLHHHTCGSLNSPIFPGFGKFAWMTLWQRLKHDVQYVVGGQEVWILLRLLMLIWPHSQCFIDNGDYCLFFLSFGIDNGKLLRKHWDVCPRKKLIICKLCWWGRFKVSKITLPQEVLLLLFFQNWDRNIAYRDRQSHRYQHL